MRNERLAALEKVAARLFQAEKDIDTACTSSAELSAAMPAARMEARLSAIIGQDALDHGVRAMGALVEARRHIVEAHRSLDAVKTQIGLDQVAIGDGSDKPAPIRPTGEASPQLRAVG